ncbi:MAG: MBL fold metallo-hydrolase [Actinomycetota bacterium]
MGHASALIEVDHVRFLTDPLLTKRVAHLRRRVALPPAEIADVDAVLISHVHLDHLHLPSLKGIPRSTTIVVPRGAGALLRRAGFVDVVELVVGAHTDIDGVFVTAVPAEHHHGRGPHSRVRAKPLGYVIGGAATRIYFPGDTDLTDAMTDLESIDAALLPIWGWGPTLGPGHLDPTGAAAATAAIDPRLVIPIHWGTYAPENVRRIPGDWFERPLTDFEQALDEHDRRDRLHALAPGERVTVLPE